MLTKYQQDIEKSIEYYRDLLLYQYSDKPKARQHIELLSAQGVASLVLSQIRDAFNIETAVGVQLDVLGEYIGLSRVVQVQIPRNYFQLDDYNNPLVNAIGMTDYQDETKNAESVFFKYVFLNADTAILDDTEYRPLLQLKAVLNTSKMTTAAIDEITQDFFADSLRFVDNQNMSLTYYVAPDATRILRLAIDLDLLPRPACVFIAGVITRLDPSAFFGFVQYDGSIEVDYGLNDYNQPDNDGIFFRYQDYLFT